MQEQAEKKITFPHQAHSKFMKKIKKRVDVYFKFNNLSRNANGVMYIKTFTHLMIYIGLCTAIMLDEFTFPIFLGLCSLLGVLKPLLAFNITHDAMHGAYSSKPIVNKIISYLFDLNGTSSYVWKFSHNVLHHTYTNIPGVDNDINKAILLRLSPVDKLYKFHYYQNWYAVILYSLIGINWVFFGDYQWLQRELRRHLIPIREIILFFTFKVLNLILFLIIPIVFLSFPWWQVCLGYLCLQVFAGLTMSLVFQLAHVVEAVQYPEPDRSGQMENEWGIHELLTTSNFATHSTWLTHLLGGLNCQIEHHLFPYICHVHYKNIGKLVKLTANEFGIPYNEKSSFGEALKSHFRALKKLGRGDNEESAV